MQKTIFSIANNGIIDKIRIEQLGDIIVLFNSYFQRIGDRCFAQKIQKTYLQEYKKYNEKHDLVSLIFGSKLGYGKQIIKSKIYYQTGISINTAADIVIFDNIENHEYIIPGSRFITVTNIISPTINELLFIMKILAHNKKYGINKPKYGMVQTQLLALIINDFPLFSTIELIKDIFDSNNNIKEEIVSKIKSIAISQNYTIFTNKDLMDALNNINFESLLFKESSANITQVFMEESI